MLNLTDLALRPDLQLGPMLVSPSRRLVEGPGGFAHLEPLIMQVFLLLLDARGKVVTRNELFDQVWGGVYVGDDSLNRTIGKIRRSGAQVVPGLFEIETIPRTGYRLTGEILEHLGGGTKGEGAAQPSGISRRALVGSGVAATAVLGSAGLWWVNRSRTNPRFDALMARGEQALRHGAPFDDATTIAVYEQAIRLEPDSAGAWGRLAFFTSFKVDDAPGPNADRLIEKAESAARRALALDPQEPNALAAMYLLKGPMMDWAERDRQLRHILAIEPNSIPAMGMLMGLLQSAGLTRESWRWNERLLELAPLSRNHLVFRAMKLWILGRVAESDKVIDRVRGLWPLYEFGFGIRFMLFALTGRPRAALHMLEGIPKTDQPPVNTALWRPALEALDTRSPQAVEAARRTCLDLAKKAPSTANISVMVLCALGQLESAFEIANGYLLWRGKVVGGNPTDASVLNDINRRMPPWLFTPPVAVMRADSRFARLCENLGLTAYWRTRGVKPDYLVYG